MIKYNGFTILRVCAVVALLLMSAPHVLQSFERKGNLSLYILIDRSLSMEEEISEVKRYVIEELIEDILIPGDSVSIYEFYREPQNVISTTIETIDEKKDLISDISRIEADKAYTDIGRALDFFSREALSPSFMDERSHTLILSDFIQEGPKGSPYAGTTKNFTHPLLIPKKEIRREGWRICIFGPGVDERAEELAREVVSDRRSAD